MISLPSGIKSIIFDLGGVLVDLSTEKTAEAFAALADISTHNVFQAYTSNPDFNAYEKGDISDSDFRNAVRRIFSINASNFEIDQCWNAMLLNLPSTKLTLLEALKQHFKTIVLSNTNAIHLNYIERFMLNGSPLELLFHKAYYSHKVRMRKPELNIYTHVLEENNLTPEQTIFLDDSQENIDAAKSLGIQTIHITHSDLIFDIFKKYD